MTRSIIRHVELTDRGSHKLVGTVGDTLIHLVLKNDRIPGDRQVLNVFFNNICRLFLRSFFVCLSMDAML